MVPSRSLALPVLLLGSLAAPGAVPAQDGIRTHASSFIFARHSTKSSSSLYAGYSMGPAGLFVAAVVSSHSDYREHVGGVFTTISHRRQGLTVALAAAEASDGYYLQTYLVPNLNAGRFRLSGTIEWYEPLESSSVRQVDVNPLTLALAVRSDLRLGAVFATGMAEDAEDTQRVGGMIEVGIPRGSLSLELLHRFQAAKPEIRIGSYVEF